MKARTANRMVTEMANGTAPVGDMWKTELDGKDGKLRYRKCSCVGGEVKSSHTGRRCCCPKSADGSKIKQKPWFHTVTHDSNMTDTLSAAEGMYCSAAQTVGARQQKL